MFHLVSRHRAPTAKAVGPGLSLAPSSRPALTLHPVCCPAFRAAPLPLRPPSNAAIRRCNSSMTACCRAITANSASRLAVLRSILFSILLI